MRRSFWTIRLRIYDDDSKKHLHTRWELHKIDDRSTNIIITEQQESNGFFQKLNDIAVGFVLGRIKKRQVIAMIDAIEKAYNGR
nr:DUF3284 domain-containing protein [Lactococcus fujiensis]